MKQPGMELLTVTVTVPAVPSWAFESVQLAPITWLAFAAVAVFDEVVEAADASGEPTGKPSIVNWQLEMVAEPCGAAVSVSVWVPEPAPAEGEGLVTPGGPPPLVPGPC